MNAKYIRRYAVDECEVYPPLRGGWLQSISAAMRWMNALIAQSGQPLPL
ncbi:MAG: hypothetical protein PHO37_09830 [Kiritimatiellae bacterium]|nr:hypothetical protein [Kiritimatiellia bacterium]